MPRGPDDTNLPLWVKSVDLNVVRSFPIYLQLQTYRCAALAYAMGQEPTFAPRRDLGKMLKKHIPRMCQLFGEGEAIR